MQGLSLMPWAVDYEYIPKDDGTLDVVCGVAVNLRSGEVLRRWRDEMDSRPFFPVGPGYLLIAHNAQAEMEAHLSLGWPLPAFVVDTMAENLLATNGLDDLPVPAGFRGGLLAAMRCQGLPARARETKSEIVARILAGPPYSAEEKAEILAYCQEDCDDSGALFRVLWDKLSADNPAYLRQALLRGEYSKAMARMKLSGLPINLELYDRIYSRWDEVRAAMVARVAEFGVYDGTTFKMDRLEVLSDAIGAADSWPRTASGQLSLTENDFRHMAGLYPVLEPLRVVYEHVTRMQSLQPLPIGSDGRVRLGMREQGWRRASVNPATLTGKELGSVGFGAYRAKTGRNQPKAVEFVPAQASWWRGIVAPSQGRVLCYYDYKSQEYGIAAHLSGDQAMMADYASGEVYIPLGIRAGLLLPDATKSTHGDFRNKILKPILLGLQYGRQAAGIAETLSAGDPLAYRENLAIARRVVQHHELTHQRYWQWVEQVKNEAQLRGFIETPLGWRMAVGDPAKWDWKGTRRVETGTKELTLQNWPMQALGGEIIRLACSALTLAGVQVICPVHDAILFECHEADLEETGALAARLMSEAAEVALGHPIPVDTSPNESELRQTGDWVGGKGRPMWELVTDAVGWDWERRRFRHG